MAVIKRVPVDHETVTVNGSKWRATAPWSGLCFDLAEPAVQSTLMLAICGSQEAPIDIHLNVPWCHPDDQDGTPEDWTDCVYRVRPRMEIGKKWKGENVNFVAFERWQGKWFVAYGVNQQLKQEG